MLFLGCKDGKKGKVKVRLFKSELKSIIGILKEFKISRKIQKWGLNSKRIWSPKSHHGAVAVASISFRTDLYVFRTWSTAVPSTNMFSNLKEEMDDCGCKIAPLDERHFSFQKTCKSGSVLFKYLQ